MKFLTGWILAFIILAGCAEETEIPEVPDYVIPENRMIEILVEMHIADATLTTLMLDKKDSIYRGEVYYQQVCNKFDITRNKLDTSIKFYAAHPAYFDQMYDDVLAKLNKRIGEHSKADTTKIDSLKNQN